jgi:DNA-binding NarL/FixJ family response regulator
MTQTTIVLADDHGVVREGLRTLLGAEPDLAVIGEEGDGLKVMALVERLKPHVLVLDVMMPGLNGLEIARQVARRAPGTRTVMLSMHANEAYVLEALRNGASAYVLKDASAAEFVKAVREVAAGRRYLSPPLSELTIEAYAHKATSVAPEPYDTLTTREREVFQLTAEGSTNVQIAARLSIGVRTVETHRANVMRKLHLRTHSDLVRYAVHRGTLPPEPPRSQ